MIRRLAKDGMTMLLVTHEMAFARETAGRVIFMDHGSIIETGSPNEIFVNPRHPRLQQFLRAVLGREPIGEEEAAPAFPAVDGQRKPGRSSKLVIDCFVPDGDGVASSAMAADR